MASVDYFRAKQAGYSDEEIDRLARARGVRVKNKPNNAGGGFLGRLGRAIIDPALDYGRMVGEAAFQSSRVLTDPTMRRVAQKTLRGEPLSQQEASRTLARPQTMFMKPEETRQFENIRTGMLEGAKRSAGAASYFAPGLIGPAGAGATLGKQVLRGAGQSALAGGLVGFSQSDPGEELGETLLGAGVSGVFGGATAAAGAGLRGIGGRLKGRGAQAAQQKAAQEAAKTGGRSAFSQPRVTRGQQAYASQFTIPTKIAKRLRPQETTKQMIDYNVSGSLDDIARTADVVTGSNGVITKMTRSAIGKAKDKVQADDALTAAAQTVQSSNYMNERQAANVMRDLARQMGKYKGQALKPGQTISGKPSALNALDAYDLAKAMEKKGWQEMSRSTYLTKRLDAEDIGSVYLAFADDLMRQVDDAVGDAGVEAVKTPQFINVLNEISPKLGKKALQAKTVSELRSVAAPFVRISQMVDYTQQAAFSAAMNLARQAGAGAGGISRYTRDFSLVNPFSWLPVEQIAASPQVNTRGGILLDRLARGVQQGAPAVTEKATGGLLEGLGSAIMSRPFMVGSALSGREMITGENIPERR